MMDTGAQFLQILREVRQEKEATVAEETKKCSACRGQFPATEEYFYIDKRAKAGLSSWCKKCTLAKQAAGREKKAADVVKTEAKPVKDNVIILDFAGYGELHKWLISVARDDFRSPDQQVMKMIKECFDVDQEVAR